MVSRYIGSVGMRQQKRCSTRLQELGGILVVGHRLNEVGWQGRETDTSPQSKTKHIELAPPLPPHPAPRGDSYVVPSSSPSSLLLAIFVNGVSRLVNSIGKMNLVESLAPSCFRVSKY